jgi:hypothetical protein
LKALGKDCRKTPTTSSKAKYDDFGELLWKEPPRPKRPTKKFNYEIAFKLLGDSTL